MKILEHNVETNEAIERDATAEELAQAQIDATNFAARMAAQETANAQRQALLARLGITADEAKLLLS